MEFNIICENNTIKLLNKNVLLYIPYPSMVEYKKLDGQKIELKDNFNIGDIIKINNINYKVKQIFDDFIKLDDITSSAKEKNFNCISNIEMPF
ncbi:hypothetical protein G6Z34_13380 [Clostridium perfringens]|uniref:Uncharacterized protein n=1 Tax=Clostridium perfringens TaxID=1502 RepID=A0AAP6WQ30_CLOPF|nr:hypothetical protein [Clostridium perfringens]NGU31077.1 hypothetical protein [Clostridium perfringens]